MLSGGTTQQIFLSISDDDIRGACQKYPQEEARFDFRWAILDLIEIRDMIKKAWSVLDSLKGGSSNTLSRLAESASRQFLVIFEEVKNYKQGLERGGTIEHDKTAERLNRFVVSITSREPLDKENGNLHPNNALDAYLLAHQLETSLLSAPDLATKKKELDELIKQAKQTANSLGNTAGKKAIIEYGQHYNREAHKFALFVYPTKFRELFKSFKLAGGAEKWLMVGFLSTIGLIIFIISFFGTFALTTNWVQGIATIVQKVFLISIFGFLARFSFRQYSIRMHLFSAYQQKAVLANTFELLLNAEGIQERRDLIITEVVTSLSTFIPSGFIRNDGPELHPLAELSRLIAALRSKNE